MKNYLDQTFSGTLGGRTVRWNIGKVIKFIDENNIKEQKIPTKDLQNSFNESICDEVKGSRLFKYRAINSKNYPIIVTRSSDGMVIVDGIHRFWKKRYIGNSRDISAYVVPLEVMPDVL